MATRCRSLSGVVSAMHLTRAAGGVLAAAILAGSVGCVPTQTAGGQSVGALSGASASTQLAPQVDDRSVRIEAIQRYDGQASEAVTGVVTVRNTSSAPRTVNIGVTWLGGDGSAISPDAAARETITLGPRESREIVFRGEQGSRDFKVALTSAMR